jgi:hypothetical protein
MIAGLAVSSDEAEWLRNVLESHKNEKVILVSHTPLGFKKAYPASDMPEGLVNREELRDIIRSYRNIVMVLAGHWHINDVYVEDDVVFCQTCSLREYPFEFRLAEVGDDGLSITTHGLRNQTFSRESLIPEKGNTWVAGTFADRIFSIRWEVGATRPGGPG